jgi:hypothetical protein
MVQLLSLLVLHPLLGLTGLAPILICVTSFNGLTPILICLVTFTSLVSPTPILVSFASSTNLANHARNHLHEEKNIGCN